MKIGELLVSNNMITVTQLQQALKAQKVYGGKLGTNLVELGLITETQLTYFLAKQLNMQAAEPSDFGNISPQVLALVPREFATKYRMLPLSVQNHKLRVAFADPLDLEAREKVAFRAGHPIIPLVAPELLINYGLEKYYGVPNQKRYLKLEEDDESEESFNSLIVRSSEISNASHELDVNVDRSNLISTAGEYNMEHLSQDLFQATSKDYVFRALSRFLERFFPKMAIFVVRQQQEIWGWSHHGFFIDQQEFRSKVVSLQDESAIADVFRHKDVILNAILSLSDQKAVRWMGGDPAHTYHLFPVLLGGRAAACFFVCSGQKDAAKAPANFSTEQIQEALTKGSMAMQMVALRRKLVEKSAS